MGRSEEGRERKTHVLLQLPPQSSSREVGVGLVVTVFFPEDGLGPARRSLSFWGGFVDNRPLDPTDALRKPPHLARALVCEAHRFSSLPLKTAHAAPVCRWDACPGAEA